MDGRWRFPGLSPDFKPGRRDRLTAAVAVRDKWASTYETVTDGNVRIGPPAVPPRPEEPPPCKVIAACEYNAPAHARAQVRVSQRARMKTDSKHTAPPNRPLTVYDFDTRASGSSKRASEVTRCTTSPTPRICDGCVAETVDVRLMASCDIANTESGRRESVFENVRLMDGSATAVGPASSTGPEMRRPCTDTPTTSPLAMRCCASVSTA